MVVRLRQHCVQDVSRDTQVNNNLKNTQILLSWCRSNAFFVDLAVELQIEISEDSEEVGHYVFAKQNVDEHGRSVGEMIELRVVVLVFFIV